MSINIKPSHEGLLHKELGVPVADPIAAKKLSNALQNAKSNNNTKEEKQIVFADNAKQWNH